MNRTIRNIAVAAAGFVLAGCETPKSQPPPAQTMEYKLPVLAPVEPDKMTVERDGIKITVTGYPYGTTRTSRKEYRPKAALLVANDQWPAEMREIPAITVHPKDIRFKVKIYNQVEHVLRLAGAVVSFQVAGQTMNVPKARYENFLNGIILPRQEAEYEVGGPDLADLANPDQAKIALLLYDIVTATDAAGNPTKRSNFEYFYTLSSQSKTEEVHEVITPISLSRPAYNLLRQHSSGGWVVMPELDRITGTLQPAGTNPAQHSARSSY